MYSVSNLNWKLNGATLEKTGEQVQLFQHVTVDGNRLKFRSYTATGKLFDKFDLIKKNGKKNLINQF